MPARGFEDAREGEQGKRDVALLAVAHACGNAPRAAVFGSVNRMSGGIIHGVHDWPFERMARAFSALRSMESFMLADSFQLMPTFRSRNSASINADSSSAIRVCAAQCSAVWSRRSAVKASPAAPRLRRFRQSAQDDRQNRQMPCAHRRCIRHTCFCRAESFYRVAPKMRHVLVLVWSWLNLSKKDGTPGQRTRGKTGKQRVCRIAGA